MSMNPPAPPPSRKEVAVATVKRTAASYRDVILLLLGIAVGKLLGA
jgi:hypothetical protein